MSGRGAGKNRSALHTRLKQMFGDDFDPIVKQAECAVKMQQIADASTDDVTAYKAAADTWDKITQYLCPKLKAIEISGDSDRPLVIIKDLTGVKRET